jgi:hypothetical protein
MPEGHVVAGGAQDSRLDSLLHPTCRLIQHSIEEPPLDAARHYRDDVQHRGRRRR